MLGYDKARAIPHNEGMQIRKLLQGCTQRIGQRVQHIIDRGPPLVSACRRGKPRSPRSQLAPWAAWTCGMMCHGLREEASLGRLRLWRGDQAQTGLAPAAAKRALRAFHVDLMLQLLPT